jgi:hypothetical protein
MIFGGAAGNGVAQRFVFGDIIDIDMAGMQEAEMRGVDLAFERLQIVAVALNETHADLTIRNIQDFERRQRRRFGARPHIDPDDAGALNHPIGFRLDLLFEIRRRHAWHIEAIASNIEFPAVVNATKPSFLIASQKQGCATMRATVIHHTDAPVAVAERNEFLAQ